MNPLRAAVLIAFFSILSRILGAVRDAVLAHEFAASQEIDIYVAAFRVPDLLFSLLILGTLSVAFIPVFMSYLNRDREAALEIASTVFNVTVVLMGLLAVLGVFLSPVFVKVLVPGFSDEAKAQTVALTKILMLSPLLFTASSVVTSILHSNKRFFLAAVSPLFYNLSIIAGVLFFYPRLGLTGLAWGVVGGAFLHFAIQFPQALRLGLRPFSSWNFAHPGVKKIAKLFVPRIFGIELGQISLLVASVLGSYLASGSLAIFYYAYNLETAPLGVFAISFAIAAFPTMSEFFGKGEIGNFKKFFASTAVQVLFLMIPISVLILLLRAQIVRLILGAGQNTAFNFADTKATAQALGFFALSLFAQSLVPLLARCFYAMQNTVIPVMSGLVSAAVNIVLAIVFVKVAGPATMALAFSIAVILHMLIMLAMLHRRLGDLEDDFLLVRTIKIGIASVMMGIATYATLYAVAPLVNMQTYVGIFIQTISAVVVAIVAYLLSGLLIKLPETSELVSVLRSWFSKFTKPVSSAIANMFTDLR